MEPKSTAMSSSSRGVSPYHQPHHGNAVAIRQEIQRFESVHPSIYALYDLIDLLPNLQFQDQMREHVLVIEDSFVNSQEWTLSRSVPELRLGVLGTYNSGKSSLVHRYLTGSYLQEESSEGGRFKKEVIVDAQSYLLLIRNEGGPPDMQFSQWVDAVIFTFSLESEISFNTVYSYYAQMSQYRAGMRDIPLILVGTQDAISEVNPRIIDDARSRLLAAELKCCAYFETCATYGLNVERVFHDVCQRIARSLLTQPLVQPVSCAVPNGGSPCRRPMTRSARESSVKGANHTADPLQPVTNRSNGAINNVVNNIKSQSPPFREPTPSSGSEVLNAAEPDERNGKAVLQWFKPLNNCANTGRNLPNSHGEGMSQSASHDALLHQSSIDGVGNCRDSVGTPPSTPGPLRKLGSFKNVPKYGSFSGNPLFRYASQSDLPTTYNERHRSTPQHAAAVHAAAAVAAATALIQLPSKSKMGKSLSPLEAGSDSPNTGLTPLLDRKSTESPRYRFSLIVERFDSFMKELSRDGRSSSSSGLTGRSRSYSVQVLEQSGDSSKDFSSPCTTPTPVRKNRRRSNIFSKKEGDDKKLKNGDAKVGHGRAIPLKQGFLFKRSSKPLSKDWQKKYVTLSDDGRLTYHSSIHDYMEDNHAKEIKLVRTTVKIPGQRPKGSETSVSSMQSAFGNRNSNGHNNNKLLDSSFESTPSSTSTSQTEAMIIPNTSATSGTLPDADSSNFSSSVPSMGSFSKNDTPNAKKKHRRIKSISKGSDVTLDSDCNLYEFVVVSLDNKQWQFAAQSVEERDEWIVAIEQQILSSLQLIDINKSTGRLSAVANATIVQNIRSAPGNGQCADCSTSAPDWASLNLGALVCIECSGIHRNLGAHLSRVRSLELDNWPPELVKVMLAVGNTVVNSIWEANTNNKQKPTSVSTREEKDQWIRSKYEQREFVATTPYTDVPLHRQLFDSVARSDVHDTLLVLSHSTSTIVNMPYSDTDARTALHIAAAVGNVVLLQLLVWNGANVKLVDHEGFSASYYAQVSGSTECFQLLQCLNDSNNALKS